MCLSLKGRIDLITLSKAKDLGLKSFGEKLYNEIFDNKCLRDSSEFVKMYTKDF